jgi:cytochrome c oxidase subunit 1
VSAAADAPALAGTLGKTWGTPRGIVGVLTSVDHKIIARRYVVTAFVFFALAGVEAAVMRLQLSRPSGRVVSADFYNQLFTMHGTTMMFLFAVPVMEAFGLYLVPLMVGTRNVSFPKLNAMGYWIYLFGGIFLYVGFALGAGADAGWFSYVPLAGPQYAPGKRVDLWAQMITFTELSALISAVEIIVTAFKQRAPGMSLGRLPLLVWSMVVMSFMVVFAMPAVMVDSTFLILDRLVGTHFFNPAEGGDALLWQHLFWFFGHPEVYIIFVPGLGMVSSIVATFARRRVFGYTALVLALVATAFLGFSLWVHHMFAVGLPWLGASFFTVASMMIAIPSGVQVFCWIATLRAGRPVPKTPLLFVVGFLLLFVLGGITGVMLASAPLDLQLHDTFFVVAHFHYVLIGGALFPLFGGIYYWFPKATGRLLDERLGRWHAALFFVGFNLTFFPMHLLGMHGMPRRVYTYLPETGWGRLNALASAGAVLIAASVVVFLVNVVKSLRRGERAGANPWGAATLEWATDSPPPPYNFRDLRAVRGADPLWMEEEGTVVVEGLSPRSREVLVTSPLDAEPDHVTVLPGPSPWPILLALGTGIGFAWSIFSPWGIVAGAVLAGAALTGWYWPSTPPKPEELV